MTIVNKFRTIKKSIYLHILIPQKSLRDGLTRNRQVLEIHVQLSNYLFLVNYHVSMVSILREPYSSVEVRALVDLTTLSKDMMATLIDSFFVDLYSFEDRYLILDMRFLFDEVNSALDCPEFTVCIRLCACTTYTRHARFAYGLGPFKQRQNIVCFT